jgi:hypothetical protein
MLTKAQIKKLGKGVYPNHRLFGPNNFTVDKDGNKVPQYLNRRQVRRTRNIQVPRSTKNLRQQEIILKGDYLEDAEAGKNVFDTHGRLKSRYIKIVYHEQNKPKKKRDKRRL